MPHRSPFFLTCIPLACLFVACTADPRPPVGPRDAGGRQDGGTPDGGRTDGGAEDGGPSPDGGPAADGGPAPDGGAGELELVPGARCDPAERAGLVVLADQGGGLYVSASLADRPPPWLGPAELSDTACAYYDGATSCGCPVEEVCAYEGGCVAPPSPAGDLTLTLAAGGQTQTLSDTSGLGRINEAVTLGGSTFSIRLSGLDQVVTSPELTVPSALPDIAGTLQGSYDAPEGIDLTWTPAAGDTDVFTHIPINHHVATPTFTECADGVTTGALHVPEAMLAPLAVATGLEFQTVDHVRFAAVGTPLGCVELRLVTVHWVSLGI